MQIANSDEGIRIMGNSINNTIIGNNITGIKTTTGNAIWVTFGATNTTISRNNLTGNNIGIYVEMSGETTISENRFETNGIGVWLSGSQNRIIRNDIISNNRGILVSIEGNYIQHNNFINNSIQAEASPTSSSNTWDDGYPSGGNYWDNYNGTDNNGDGIGDAPYIIDENNQDNYPLMNQSIIPEFPSWIILPLLMITTLTVIVYKKRMLKR
jgi:parallel beta-helix repeat protein